MATIPAQARTWQRREPRTQLMIWAGWLAAVALFVGCFQLISDKTIWAFVWDAPSQASDLAVPARAHLAPLFDMVSAVRETVVLDRPARLGGWLAAARDALAHVGRLSADEQQRVHQQMGTWAQLTPQQRAKVRDGVTRQPPVFQGLQPGTTAIAGRSTGPRVAARWAERENVGEGRKRHRCVLVIKGYG